MRSLGLTLLLVSSLAPLSLPGCGGSPAGTDGGADLAGLPPGDDGGPTRDLLMPPQSCGDGQKNGNESDLDCGGSCAPCATGKRCGGPGDCQSGVCTASACAAPSCTDTVKNGDETDVDCGGACPKCSGGKGCKVATDCQTNMCNGGRCAAGPLTFGKATSFPVGRSPWGIVAVDVNGDQQLDLAISGGEGVQILLGKGDGSFGAAATFGAPAAQSIPGEIAAADFNKDGRVDLVWPDFNNNFAYVALGKGDGTFPAAKMVKVKGGPQTAISGDFDGDGRADVAMGLAIDNAVAVMTGNGDGTFGPPASYPSGGTNANCVGALDLDGDGKQDLVVGNLGTDWRTGNQVMPGSLYSLINLGPGTFKAASKLFDAVQPTAMVVRDFDGDGKADFAFTDMAAKKTLVSLRGGAPMSYGAGSQAFGIGAADFNLDGKMDLAVTSFQSSVLVVFPGSGGGALGMATNVLLGYPNPGRIATGDFNRDGKVDLAVVNFNANMMPVQPIVSVVLNATM